MARWLQVDSGHQIVQSRPRSRWAMWMRGRSVPWINVPSIGTVSQLTAVRFSTLAVATSCMPALASR